MQPTKASHAPSLAGLESQPNDDHGNNHTNIDDEDDDDDVTSLKEIAAGGVNDCHVITQIVEEYEQRLKAQLMLAKEDMVNELADQIQVSLVIERGMWYGWLCWRSIDSILTVRCFLFVFVCHL